VAQNKVKHRKLLALASSHCMLTMARLTARESEVKLLKACQIFVSRKQSNVWVVKNQPLL